MKLLFIRHGEGDHTLQTPDSLHTRHPELTQKGKEQAERLKEQLGVQPTDLVVVSPTLRTIQTAHYLVHNTDQIIAHPFVGPRIFPFKDEIQTLPCDETLTYQEVKEHELKVISDPAFFGGEGFNKVSELEFDDVMDLFLKWCEALNKERILVVTHDGTITRYREKITGFKLTRENFLKDAGWVEVNYSKKKDA